MVENLLANKRIYNNRRRNRNTCNIMIEIKIVDNKFTKLISDTKSLSLSRSLGLSIFLCLYLSVSFVCFDAPGKSGVSQQMNDKRNSVATRMYMKRREHVCVTFVRTTLSCLYKLLA